MGIASDVIGICQDTVDSLIGVKAQLDVAPTYTVKYILEKKLKPTPALFCMKSDRRMDDPYEDTGYEVDDQQSKGKVDPSVPAQIEPP